VVLLLATVAAVETAAARPGVDYRGALGQLCVTGIKAVDATPASKPIPFATRLGRAVSVLTPLRSGAKRLTPPGVLAAPHKELLRSLDRFVQVSSQVRARLRGDVKPTTALAPSMKALSGATTSVRGSFSKLGVWPCSDLLVAAQQLLAIDAKAPSARALPASGKKGGSVVLRYTLRDDSGLARATIAVYAGKRVVVKPSAESFAPARGAVRTTAWTPAATLAGSLRFCVQAQDRAGNKSKQSCAAVTLR
jgi:hypothetical protein